MSRGHHLSGRSPSSRMPRLFAVLCAGALGSGPLLAADMPPAFTQQPSPKAAPVGMNVLLSARSSSDWPVFYQWLVDGKPLTGRTNDTLSLFCVSMVQSGQVYSVVASNIYGAVTSAPAMLQVSEPDFGASQMVWGLDETVVHERFMAEYYREQVGRQINVRLQDTSVGGIWGTGIYTDDSSISAAAYHAGLLPVGSTGTVAILISGPQSSFAASTQNGITSSAYTRSWPGSFQFLGLVPTIIRHPISQVRMVGGTAEFAAEAIGQGTLSYQWKHNGEVIPGATDPTLVVTVRSESDAGTYAVTATDDNGSNSSEYAILGVMPVNVVWPSTPIADPALLLVGEFRHMVITGQTNYGSVWGNGFYSTDSEIQKAAAHDGWARHGEAKVITVVRLPEQSVFPAANRNDVNTTRYTGRYKAFAIAGAAPTIVKDPISQAAFPGDYVRLTTEASHPLPITYQWRKNGIAIPGATGTELTVQAGPASMVTVYDVVANVPGNPIPSQSAYLFSVADDAVSMQVADANEALANLARPNTVVYAPLKAALSPSYIYGTGVYTSDSNPETAAVHADRLATGQVTEVGMYALGLWNGFIGSTRNGLMSGSYGGMAGYVFLFPPAPPPPPTLTALSGGRLQINGVAGHHYQIWATPSLTQPQWSLLDTVTLSSASQVWQDPQAATQSARLYRVAWTP